MTKRGTAYYECDKCGDTMPLEEAESHDEVCLGGTEIQTRLSTKKQSFKVTGSKVTVGTRRAGFLTCLSAKFNNALAYVSPRKREDHYFRKYQGYGLNAELLEYLRKHKYVYVVLIEDGKRYLLSKVSDWLANGFQYYKPGYEEQLVLKEENMKEVGKCF